jgi:uncharacterized surface protein with fasciclin (FAS1) repeats
MIKNIQKFLFSGRTLLMIIAAFLLFNGCKKSKFDQYYSTTDGKGGYLYDKIKSNPDFSIFAAGLDRANLVQYINIAGLYTVFAPTDSAFKVYFKAKNYNSINDVPVDTLFNMLSYHIVNNMWYYYDLKTRYSTLQQTVYMTRSKKFVSIDVTATDTLKVNGIAVIKRLRDIDSDNGVIQGIGKLLTYSPNLEQLLITDPQFSVSTFYRLMKLTSTKTYDRYNSYDKNRDGILDSVFYTSYPLLYGVYTSIDYKTSTVTSDPGGLPVYTTILMPSNTVLDPLIASALAKIPSTVTDKIAALSPQYAAAILESYFIPDRTVSSSELIARPVALSAINNTAIPTLTVANFLRKDVMASNGAIHMINITFPQTDKLKSAIGLALTDPDLTMFWAALQKAGLLGTYATTSKTGTLFAPTNAAFISAGLDVTNLRLNGAPITSDNFNNIVKALIVDNANIASTSFPNAVYATLLSATETLTFNSTGTKVTSAGGITANVTLPAVAIGPSNVGYVYKVDQVLFPL